MTSTDKNNTADQIILAALNIWGQYWHHRRQNGAVPVQPVDIILLGAYDALHSHKVVIDYTSHAQELHALIFNAINYALQEVWPISVPLPVVRERCTEAVLKALSSDVGTTGPAASPPIT